MRWSRATTFGEPAGQALTRYLRVLARHAGAALPALFSTVTTVDPETVWG